MRLTILMSLIILSACDEAAMDAHRDRWVACNQAKTSGEAFGTPSNRGPCWGRLITVSHGFGMSYYHMRTITGGQAILMYDGDELVSITRG